MLLNERKLNETIYNANLNTVDLDLEIYRLARENIT